MDLICGICGRELEWEDGGSCRPGSNNPFRVVQPCCLPPEEQAAKEDLRGELLPEVEGRYEFLAGDIGKLLLLIKESDSECNCAYDSRQLRNSIELGLEYLKKSIRDLERAL